MLSFFKFVLLIGDLYLKCNGAKILAVFPSPFPSHQSVFRPLTQELARRGHEVVVITTDPVGRNLPPNLTEIDIHDVSYEFRDNYYVKVTGNIDDLYDQVEQFYDMFGKLFEIQINTAGVRNLINNKDLKFDVVLSEACVRPALVFSHIFKAPVILVSSLGSVSLFTKYLGTPTHPILYPSTLHQRLTNLTLWEKATEVYKDYLFAKMLQEMEEKENEMLKKSLGDDVPPLSELEKNVAMLMINVHHVWEGSRPVPPNVVYLGGMHLEINDTNKLSKELKTYLDTSKHGVIYMSLGSLVIPSRLDRLKIVIQAFSGLPYDVLLKWDTDYLPECPNNVKIVKWTPQRDLLHHPNIKLFITQGGMQSTDEAIVAGVPVIGVPILGDQWYNVEKLVDLKIGLRIDLETVTEKKILDAINTVIEDKSYTENVKALRELIYDQPESSLHRAVWWTEYILRHGRSPHLMAPAAHMSVWEFFEIDLLIILLSCSVVLLLIAVYLYLRLKAFVLTRNIDKVKLK